MGTRVINKNSNYETIAELFYIHTLNFNGQIVKADLTTA